MLPGHTKADTTSAAGPVHRRVSRLSLAGLAVLGAMVGASPIAATAAQPQSAAATLAAAYGIETLPVTVVDKKGALIPNLTPSDFKLKIDNLPHAVTSVTAEVDQPCSLILDVDTSPNADALPTAARTAAGTFLDRMLAIAPTSVPAAATGSAINGAKTGATTGAANGPKTGATTGLRTTAAVLHFDHEVELLTDLSARPSRVARGVSELGPTPASPGMDTVGAGDAPPSTLYDSVYLAATQLHATPPTRKVIVVLSDGRDHLSRKTLSDAVEAAQRTGTLVFALYTRGEAPEHEAKPQGNGGSGRPGGGIGFPGGGMGHPGGGTGYPGGGGMGYPGGGGSGTPQGGSGGGGQHTPHIRPVDGKKIMEQLAGETGGDFFEINHPEDYGRAFAQIESELRHSYALQFILSPSETARRLHSIDLRSTHGGRTVLAPSGFYGKGRPESTSAAGN